ncbi:MAG: hypothetical protein A2X18_02315 [Bacteroidetes bacterium GWF2_40_14]|nr:MAG: hypothetical protein A2X18_02315 [Bacteroidetes bacterium GWF2_40_14]
MFSCAKENSFYSNFPVEITDTLSEYSIHFNIRLPEHFDEDSIPMVLTISSPVGEKFRDTISFPIAKNVKYTYVQEVRSGVWRDLRWIYRDKVKFPRRGKWEFTVKHLSNMDKLQKIRDLQITIMVR